MLSVQENQNELENKSEVIFGKNSVVEALKSAETADTLYLSADDNDKSINYIVAMAKDKGAVVKKIHSIKMNKMCGSEKHQGVALLSPICNYCTVDDIFDYASSKGEPPLMVILDGIEDPHNLGAIIRTAECVGAHGVLLPKRGNCTVNATVHRASAGACSYMKIARIGNLASEIKDIKKRGVFCYCADMDGANCYTSDLTGPAALIVGSEGFGVSRLVRELCDVSVSIPMRGEMNSLNASVATGILLYEFIRQRLKK